VSPSLSESASACVCKAGYSGSDGGPCTTCAAGKYKNIQGPSECVECAAGTYSWATGATSAATCNLCPAESYSDSGSVGLTSCVCNAGYAGENGGKICMYLCVDVY
jgi:hypothetical protein